MCKKAASCSFWEKEWDMEEKGNMESINRRELLAATAALGVMGTAALAPKAADAQEDGTSVDVASLGGSTMGIDELNRRRHELVDSVGEHVCEDGTVVPAVWNKLRALFNSYGLGYAGDVEEDVSFDFLMANMTEDEAQAYIEMPYGVVFTAAEFAAASGRDEAECADVCEDLSHRGLLWRARRAGVAYYHHVAIVHGVFEYNLNRYYEDGWISSFTSSYMKPVYANAAFLTGGTPFYYAIPCEENIVADEEGILPLDDYQKIIDRNEVICVAPCQCRLMSMAAEGIEAPAIGSEELKDYMSPLCGHPLETCMVFGEEAEYYIENGIARQIDRDEAKSILERSVDHGMILQSCFTQGSEVICSCTGECCGILKVYVAGGPETCEELGISYANTSNYDLVYDKDACVKCGACVERCPMFAISMDDEGYPQVNALCMRCGQCGIVCPAQARKLTAKPAEQRLEMPHDMLGDYNLKAAYRFEHDFVH